MRATAIIPVKRFGAAKQRLATALGPGRRAALTEAMLADVLVALEASRRVERLIVVTGEPSAERVARLHAAEVIGDPEDAGHSPAACRGVERSLELGAEAAALLPGDCPLIDPGELDDALDRLSVGGVAIVPDRHGTGTNALLLAPPDAIEPAFGEGSRRRHEGVARAGSHEPTIEWLPSLALDVDTPDDLAAVGRVLAYAPARAPHTATVLRVPTRA